jgi:thioesterase domain-containing protein
VSVLAFLTDLQQRQIRLWADGDQLRCNAPVGVLTPVLRAQLTERKQEILAFLRTAEESAQGPRAIVPLRRSGTRPPVFAIPGHNGDVFMYRTLAAYLGDDQPFFGLQPPGLDAHSEPLRRVEPLADYFALQVRAALTEGACIVAAYCAGGAAALELARRLQKDGVHVQMLALFGCRFPTAYRWPWAWRRKLLAHAGRIADRRSVVGGLSYIGEMLQHRREAHEKAVLAAQDPVLMRRARLESVTLAAVRRYEPARFDGHAALFLPSRAWLRHEVMSLDWQSIVSTTDIYVGPDSTTPHVMLLEPDASVFADYLRQACEKSRSL